MSSSVKPFVGLAVDVEEKVIRDALRRNVVACCVDIHIRIKYITVQIWVILPIVGLLAALQIWCKSVKYNNCGVVKNWSIFLPLRALMMLIC